MRTSWKGWCVLGVLAAVLAVPVGAWAEGKPVWMKDPYAARPFGLGRSLYAVGSAGRSRMRQMQVRVAQQQARVGLGRAYLQYIDDMLAALVKAHKDWADPGAAATKHFIAKVSGNMPKAVDATLYGSSIVAVWTDDRTGALWVLAELPLARQLEESKRALMKKAREGVADAFKAHAPDFLKAMDAEIDRRAEAAASAVPEWVRKSAHTTRSAQGRPATLCVVGVAAPGETTKTREALQKAAAAQANEALAGQAALLAHEWVDPLADAIKGFDDEKADTRAKFEQKVAAIVLKALRDAARPGEAWTDPLGGRPYVALVANLRDVLGVVHAPVMQAALVAAADTLKAGDERALACFEALKALDAASSPPADDEEP